MVLELQLTHFLSHEFLKICNCFYIETISLFSANSTLLPSTLPPSSTNPNGPKRERERRNALSKEFVYSFISNVELQLYIYRRLAQISLTHIIQDNWIVHSTCALRIKLCVK